MVSYTVTDFQGSDESEPAGPAGFTRPVPVAYQPLTFAYSCMANGELQWTVKNGNAYDVPFQYSSQLQPGMYRLEVQLGDIRVSQKVMKQ